MNMNIFCYSIHILCFIYEGCSQIQETDLFQSFMLYKDFLFEQVLLPTSSLRLDWKQQKTLGLQPETWGAENSWLIPNDGMHSPRTNSKFAPENRPKCRPQKGSRI